MGCYLLTDHGSLCYTYINTYRTILTSTRQAPSTHGPLSSQAPSFLTHGPLSSQAPSFLTHGPLSSQAPSFLTHSPLSSQAPSFLTHSPLSSQAPSFLTHSPLSSQAPSFLTHSPLSSQAPSFLTHSPLSSHKAAWLVDCETDTTDPWSQSHPSGHQCPARWPLSEDKYATMGGQCQRKASWTALMSACLFMSCCYKNYGR